MFEETPLGSDVEHQFDHQAPFPSVAVTAASKSPSEGGASGFRFLARKGVTGVLRFSDLPGDEVRIRRCLKQRNEHTQTTSSGTSVS